MPFVLALYESMSSIRVLLTFFQLDASLVLNYFLIALTISLLVCTPDAAISQRASFAHLSSPSSLSSPTSTSAEGVAGAGVGAGVSQVAVAGTGAGAGAGAGVGTPLVQLSHTPFEAATELGRAEAIGSLVRIFCAVRTHEAVLRRYLARFYICLHYALKSVDVRLAPRA